MKRTSMLKASVMTVLVLLVGCNVLVDKEAAAAQATYTPTMGDYCVQPPFLSGYVPPQVLFTMGKDHKYYLPAYNDSSDIDNDGFIETTYKHSFDYYGYFDSHKCYTGTTGNSGLFTPFGITSNKYCETAAAGTCTNNAGAVIDCSGKFSGNFLNWATMSRSDITKMVIYGGYRTSDNNGTNYAELSGEFIPQDGHIWGKEYCGTDAAKLFPGGASCAPSDANPKRALFCVNGTGSISQLKILPDVTAVGGVSVSGGLRAWHWINVNGNADICSDNKIDLDGNGSASNATLTGLTKYNVTVRVCDPASGYNYVGDWEKKHCKNYSTASPQDPNGPWRPVGLMQVYGETPNSTKVCSKDMATACTNNNDCTGNGECLNAANMFFGLIMGTYQNPKSGGVLRKAIYSINEETNQTNGVLQTSASSGKGLLMKSIEALKAPATYPLSSHWGNPIAEIMYEGMRYWAGKTSATTAFMANINSNGGNTADKGNYISVAPWDQPATLFPSCSMPFNLVFSDVYNSFDHDEVPGSAFNSFTGDLTGLNVSTLANQIWTNENLGNSLIVGESGTASGPTTDGTCGGKTVSGLSNVKGLCPSEGSLSGSYYPAAVALYGHNSMKSQMGAPSNVLTYVVAFPSNVPNLTFYTDNNKPVLVAPYGKSVSNTSPWSCTTANTSFPVSTYTNSDSTTASYLKFLPKTNSTSNCPTIAVVSFYLEEKEYDTSVTPARLKYAKFVVASDDLGGGDYDLDTLVRYTVCAKGFTSAAAIAACPATLGSDQISVKTERVYSAAGNTAALGFTISNVDNSDSYLVLEHAKPASGSYPSTMGDYPGTPLWTTHLPNTSASLTFTATSSGATLPKSPLWYAAKYGGFKAGVYSNAAGIDLPYTDPTCSYALTDPNRDPRCNGWSSKVPGVPDNYFEVSNPSEMENKLRDALESILARVSSGTAASILNNSEGSGASLLQAVFYPKKDFDGNTSTSWIGEIHNMWYYLDPFFNTTTIREDSNQDYKLNLKDDKIAQFYFDTGQNKTQVRLFNDNNGDGVPDSATPDQVVDPDNVKSLWKAGRKLWARTLTSTPRLIYTHTDITASGFDDTTSKLTPFGAKTDGTSNITTLTGNATFLSLMPTTDVNNNILTTDVTRAGKLIAWTHGTDQANDTDGSRYRSRKVTISNCSITGSGCQTSDSIYTREWKLGDIVSATPKLISNKPLNGYNLPVPHGYADIYYDAFTKTNMYKNRGMVFVGSNDGMLHAFRLGVLKEISRSYDKAQFNNSSGVLATSADDLGKEEWAFIPKQVLPYLSFLKNPDYCHIFTVDKSPSIADVSIAKPAGFSGNYWDAVKASDGSTWRTVLVGGMGIGGAAKWNGDTTVVAPDACVKTPVKVPTTSPATTSAATTGIGYSSYYALDVTNPASPKYLWEFPSTNVASGGTSAFSKLGFSTTGPAIVRIAAHTDTLVNGKQTRSADNTKNGRWFAVFASGSTGPIDKVKRQFNGQSDQQLRIFIVDMADGTLLRTIDTFADGTALPSNAFAGSLSTSWIDTDRATSTSVGWYSDDAVYIGYSRECTGTDTACTSGTWTKGGVLRLSTSENTDPAQWKVSKVIDGIGPVTTSITKLQDRRNNNLWLYFGTGRYFFKGDDTTTNTQSLYGVKEPCYASARIDATATNMEVRRNSINPYCTTAVSGTLVDQSGAPSATINTAAPGWKVTLDGPASGFSSERMITDPVASPAGAVFFTTFKPSNDVCKFGGNSLIWALRYDTGGVPPARAMQGKALIQVSTGAFAEISLSTAFSNPGDSRLDGRRLATPITGVPPTSQGLSLITNPPAVKKFLHVREK